MGYSTVFGVRAPHCGVCAPRWHSRRCRVAPAGPNRFARVFAPKVRGGWHLDRLTRVIRSIGSLCLRRRCRAWLCGAIQPRSSERLLDLIARTQTSGLAGAEHKLGSMDRSGSCRGSRSHRSTRRARSRSVDAERRAFGLGVPARRRLCAGGGPTDRLASVFGEFGPGCAIFSGRCDRGDGRGAATHSSGANARCRISYAAS